MLKRLDDGWLKVEKVAVVVGFLVMSVVVFADVLHRVAADRAWQTWTKLGLLALVGWGLTWGAIRTATQGKSPHGRAAALGLLGPAVLFAGSWLFVTVVTAGVVWAQTLALVLTLWVGFLGASIATKENKHLKVDAAERIFKGRAKRMVGLVSNLIASLATGALGVLAFRFCQYNYDIYVETEGAGGDFEGLPIPKFLAFGILPITLGTMSLRFLGNAVDRFRGIEPPPDVPMGAAAAEPAASEGQS